MQRYKLIFFVPVEHVEKVKDSILSEGAGHIGNYSHCAFESEGIGQFMPRLGSNPFIGNQDMIERVREKRVEILCTEENIKQAVLALKKSHPYEEVAYEVYRIENY